MSQEAGEELPKTNGIYMSVFLSINCFRIVLNKYKCLQVYIAQLEFYFKCMCIVYSQSFFVLVIDLRVLCMRFACKRSPPKSHDISSRE